MVTRKSSVRRRNEKWEMYSKEEKFRRRRGRGRNHHERTSPPLMDRFTKGGAKLDKQPRRHDHSKGSKSLMVDRPSQVPGKALPTKICSDAFITHSMAMP